MAYAFLFCFVFVFLLYFLATRGQATFQLWIEVYSQITVTMAIAVQITVPFVAAQLYCPSSFLLTPKIVS